ncbi:DUF885 domain-containing protein [Subtercola boreus]|uniref:DUF885 domain-containing protein n=1 Tax=Subtercola boreus TaxID=120213 RepID=A0A3E0WB74_9MICO|nr:DUF885 domain-containing protein [Subtercola boreus]RFA21268.1 hypothetical protein B7R24_07750 [Subtercola boreus]RFA21651.1 hypothetical protein B7R23_07695 [Subtercola boreus]RFA27621.1 hypothetical protein B7R25_07820 [Subtercola boreus]
MTSSTSEDVPRTPTAVDRIAERWVDTLVDLEPAVGTYIGRNEANDRYGDYSPAGHESYVAAVRSTLADLDAATPADEVDAVTRTDLRSELRLMLESSDARLHLRDLNVIESPSQQIREVYDLMPTETVDDWEVVGLRLAGVGTAIDGYIETLRQGIREGVVPARRQVHEVLLQAEKNVGETGFFGELVRSPDDLADALSKQLRAGAGVASAAYERLASFLADELMPAASEVDGVGRELYALESRKFLGATVDLDETYEWGVAELARMVGEQESIAREILPGASVREAIAHLDADPAHKLFGTAALQRWMQETSNRAVEELSASQFDIPDEIKTIECMIAPTDEGGIYYTGPTDDFSRPGRMWWSVPTGVTEFDTWRELTTVYHEGVPGHHLQIGQAVYNRSKLNTWRRQLAGTSGHAEGWALYAERLMEELGYLDDPADRLGMLDGQRMRAARVVLDIGVHLGKPRLDGTGVWDAEYALEFLRENVNMNDGFIRFEVNRYLGWPGQAPSYKVGQRIWEQLRDDQRARQGSAFDIREFHRRALDLGGVRLDTLVSAMQR